MTLRMKLDWQTGMTSGGLSIRPGDPALPPHVRKEWSGDVYSIGTVDTVFHAINAVSLCSYIVGLYRRVCALTKLSTTVIMYYY